MVRTRADRKVNPTTPEPQPKSVSKISEEPTISITGGSESDNESDDTNDVEMNNDPNPSTIHTDSSGNLAFVIDKNPSGSVTGNAVNLECDDDSSGDSSDSESEAEDVSKSRNKGIQLSSSLQPGPGVLDTYLNVNAYKSPVPQNNKIDRLLGNKSKEQELMKKSLVSAAMEKKERVPVYQESVRKLKKQRQAERSQTKGKGWFDMKAQELTDEKKNEMLVLQMRRSLDPKRFYKAPDIRGVPKFFQMGKIVDGPGEFYNRIPKKQQKKSLVDELLADAEFKKFSKRKLSEIQESKHKWRGAQKHMKRLKKKKR